MEIKSHVVDVNWHLNTHMKFYLTIILLLGSILSHAQYKLKGIVLDSKREAVVGVSVWAESTKGVTTDSLGKFSMNVASKGPIVIHLSHKSYQSFDTTINDLEKEVEIVLKEAENELEDVVIVASSRTNSTIEDLPTKVEVLGSEEVFEENQIKPGNIASLLGDIAGIQIQQTNSHCHRTCCYRPAKLRARVSSRFGCILLSNWSTCGGQSCSSL